MNHLSDKLQHKFASIISVEKHKHADLHITTPRRADVISAVEDQDADFAGTIRKQPSISFSFGDKYFNPCLLEAHLLLCIPLRCADVANELTALLAGDKNKPVREEVIADFNRMKPLLEEAGHFHL